MEWATRVSWPSAVSQSQLLDSSRLLAANGVAHRMTTTSRPAATGGGAGIGTSGVAVRVWVIKAGKEMRKHRDEDRLYAQHGQGAMQLPDQNTHPG